MEESCPSMNFNDMFAALNDISNKMDVAVEERKQRLEDLKARIENGTQRCTRALAIKLGQMDAVLRFYKEGMKAYATLSQPQQAEIQQALSEIDQLLAQFNIASGGKGKKKKAAPKKKVAPKKK
jgi:uncharacterized protein YukE